MRQPIDHFVDGLAFSYQELSRFQDMICGLPKLCDLLTAVVDAHKIVAVIVPEQGIWGDGIDFPAVSMHALFGGGIIEVAEGDFPSLCNSGLDAVYADVDALVDSFYAAVDVQMPFKQYGVHFVAIANSVDSDDQNSGEFAPFLNIMNEWYLRDLSRKQKTAIRVKGESGKPSTNCAIYGYKKDPENKYH